ncbi:NAD-dependent epimerase/dehydratase family protein [Mycobacterium sp.]|uniref:NAD-dependent epimerase/dehydratase family protein n=1 Tax=Mycobacterium sp. TaxID=1785 RepID=UPI003BACA0F5
MNTVIFGATGFIGSHVAEQLIQAGHVVTAVIRQGSRTEFLHQIGANVTAVDFTDDTAIQAAITEHDIVYCCLGSPKMHQSLQAHRAIDVVLTRRVMEAAARAGAKRFIQLSTVQIYGFSRPPTPIDENHPSDPKYSFTQVALEREGAVQEVANKTGIDLVVLRPANTMGKRDSSMGAIFDGHKKGIVAVFGTGENRWSCIDTRDVGRAMAWLGELPEAAGNTYLVSGYETTWAAIKNALDQARGRKSTLIRIPVGIGKLIARALEILLPYSVDLPLVPFAIEVMSRQTLFDDRKIRSTGFRTKYTLQETIAECVNH